jgi:hypothetical protein
VLGCALLGSTPLHAQDVYRSGDPQAPDENFSGAATPAPNLQKYLSPDGRFIDKCRYWHDHPDADTLRYGQPDHFAPGKPMGETRSFNGQPAPYERCAEDPCPPFGTICWRNPQGSTPQPPLRAQIDAWLARRGCKTDATDAIYCPANQILHPGPPTGPVSSGLVRTTCRVINTGVACDRNGPANPGNETFSAGDSPPPPPPPPPPPRYAPVDWLDSSPAALRR